jgi:enamine deaminase RidA (YjgF/YER057c/UK114 family)
MNDERSRFKASSGSRYESSFVFSRAVRVGHRIVVSGTAPIWPSGECPDDVTVQTRRCFEIIENALAQLGADLSDVIRTRMYLTSAADADAVGRVHGEVFNEIRPAASMVVVAALLDPRWKIEAEAEAATYACLGVRTWPAASFTGPTSPYNGSALIMMAVVDMAGEIPSSS